MAPVGDADFTEKDYMAEVRKFYQGDLHIGADGMRLNLKD